MSFREELWYFEPLISDLLTVSWKWTIYILNDCNAPLTVKTMAAKSQSIMGWDALSICCLRDIQDLQDDWLANRDVMLKLHRRPSPRQQPLTTVKSNESELSSDTHFTVSSEESDSGICISWCTYEIISQGDEMWFYASFTHSELVIYLWFELKIFQTASCF